MECSGLLATHTLYEKHGWKSRFLRLLEESLPSIPDIFQHFQEPPMLVHTTNYKNRYHIPKTVSVHKRYYDILHLQDINFVNVFCESSMKTPCLCQRFYSWVNHVLLELASPTFTKKMCGKMKILMPFIPPTTMRVFH
jgi:hypothetical protein